MTDEKARYETLCRQEASIPLFMQHWWMDAVCEGKHWDVMLACDSAGHVVAAMPYLWSKRMGMKYVLMPQQTQIGGVWMRPDAWRDEPLVRSVCEDFSHRLEDLRLAYYYQQYPLASPVAELMGGYGFKLKRRVTYRVDDLTDMDHVLSGFSKNKRRQILKAANSVVDMSLSAAEFYRFHSDCLSARRRHISYSESFFMRIYEAAVRHGQGQIVALRSVDGQLQAAAFIVWDRTSAYYLIPCYDPVQKDSGASARIVLECMKFVRAKSVAFDFEGSMDSGIARHYSQFGSLPTLYYGVERVYNPLFRLALWWNRIRG